MKVAVEMVEVKVAGEEVGAGVRVLLALKEADWDVGGCEWFSSSTHAGVGVDGSRMTQKKA